MAIKEMIVKVVEGRSLRETEAAAAMLDIVEGLATPAQIAALAVGLRIKGETAEEVAGLARVMRRYANRVEAGPDVIDIVGTGGDGARTFNISTLSAFVVAAAGGKIAKHGNRGVTSNCGAADILEALGVAIDLPPDGVAACVRETGFGFMFAPLYHPAMRHAVGPRREIGVRTVFNLLGPLTNPAGARRQVVGVYAHDLVEPIAAVLVELGADHALVVHGAGGLDELTPTGENWVAEVRDGAVRTATVDPRTFGAGPGSPDDLMVGGDPATNAAIIRTVFDGETGPRRDAVILNAGAAIHVAGLVDTLEEGVERARDAIDSGAATETLDRLVAFTQARAEAHA